MGMFKKEATTTESEIGGIDVLRLATRSRRHKGHLGRIASDLQISVASLEAFADGKPLPEPTLQALAKEIFNAELDIEADRLRQLNPPVATPLRTAFPEPVDPKSSRYYVPHDPTAAPRFPKSEKPEPVKPKTGRPGWIGGFFGA